MKDLKKAGTRWLDAEEGLEGNRDLSVLTKVPRQGASTISESIVCAHQKIIKEKLLILAEHPEVPQEQYQETDRPKEDYYRYVSAIIG